MVGRRYSHLNGTAFIGVILCACLGTGGIVTALLFGVQGHAYGVVLAVSTSMHSWWGLSRAWLRIKLPASGTMSLERKWGEGVFQSNAVRAAALVWLALAATFHASFASSYGVWGDSSPEHRAFAIWSGVATFLPLVLGAELWPDTSFKGGGWEGEDITGRGQPWTGLGIRAAGAEERVELLSVAPAPSPPPSALREENVKSRGTGGRKRRKSRAMKGKRARKK